MSVLLHAAVSTSTLKQYEKVFTSWKAFLSPQEDAVNLTPARFVAFLEHSITQKKSLSFIELACAAISHFHLAAFNDSPTAHPSSKWALAAARRLLKKPSRQALPITPDLLRDIHAIALADDSFVTWRTYWRISMSFHGLFRWSDLAVMTTQHVRFLPDAVEFNIPRSKTDQLGQGIRIVIPADPSSALCPVALTRRYIDLLQSPPSGWLLPRARSLSGRQVAWPKYRLSYSTCLSDLPSLDRTHRTSGLPVHRTLRPKRWRVCSPLRRIVMA